MNSDIFEILLLIGIVLFSIVSASYATYRKRRRTTKISNSSILLTYYTDGVHLIPAKSDKIGDMHYNAIVTLDLNMLLYRVELPFASKSHLLSVPVAPDVVQLDPTGLGSLMEKVHLEGDFSNYFTFFAERDQQSLARYILDPKAMVFTIDFCRSHNWELINNELYFLQSNADNTSDSTKMFDDILTFIDQIRPAVQIPVSDLELSLTTPYNEDRRDNLCCPLCSLVMTNSGDYFMCPSNHGVLINARDLTRLSKGSLKIEIDQSTDNHGSIAELICPSCASKMHKVNFNGGKNTIDSCVSCTYRWLDQSEIKNLSTVA